MKNLKTILISFILIAVLTSSVFAIDIIVENFYNQFGVKFPKTVSSLSVNKKTDGTVADSSKLGKLGVKGIVKGEKAQVTFKSENMVEIVFPAKKQKAYFIKIKDKWELQSIMKVK